MSKLVAFTVPARAKAYFFAGDQYARFDVATRTVDAGYPRSIAGNWHGAFERDIDAALVGFSGVFAYFFRGTEYVKLNLGDNTVLRGWPRPIAGRWPGLFDSGIDSGIDAVLPTPDGKHALFFRGSEYTRYDLVDDRAVDGYPRSIAEDWPGVFGKDIDTALAWPDGHAYFFRGDEYVKVDTSTNTVLASYPKPIEGNWHGLPRPSPSWAYLRVHSASSAPPADPVAVESPGGGRIANKQDPAPGDLVIVSGYSGRKVRLHHLAATYWRELLEAARADGIADPLLLPTSGYRSGAYQKTLFDRAVIKYGSPAAARKWVAPPGGSAHQSGRAIDFWMGASNGGEYVDEQRGTAVWAWLVDNAERFGFYPYDDKPWHWEYNP